MELVAPQIYHQRCLQSTFYIIFLDKHNHSWPVVSTISSKHGFQCSSKVYNNSGTRRICTSSVRNQKPSLGTRYFEFNIPQQDVWKRVVFFGAQKTDDLKHKQESTTPVKFLNISPQKQKFDPSTQEYRLNNYSKVVTQRVPFPWKDISAALANASVKFVLDSCIPGDIISLKASPTQVKWTVCLLLHSKDRSEEVWHHRCWHDRTNSYYSLARCNCKSEHQHLLQLCRTKGGFL